MKLILVAATTLELEPLQKALAWNPSEPEFQLGSISLHALQTGVGLTATAYAMGKHLANESYDLAINFGLAGSFHSSFALGEVVEVQSDCFADLGAEDGTQFLSLADLALQDPNDFPFRDSKVWASHSLDLKLPKVSGISVNRVHGHESSIEQVKAQFAPDVESMEGAAFYYACAQEKIPALQIRAISNRVEKRNREAWDIPLALRRGTKVIIDLIHQLNHEN